MVLGAALLFTRGEPLWATALLVAASPLDRLAERLATFGCGPSRANRCCIGCLRPAHGLALLGLAWFETRHGGGWGALVAAAAAIAFGEAARVERRGRELGPDLWLLSPRSAVFLRLPFAAFGAWSLLTVALAVYAAASFFIVQQLVRPIAIDAALTHPLLMPSTCPPNGPSPRPRWRAPFSRALSSAFTDGGRRMAAIVQDLFLPRGPPDRAGTLADDGHAPRPDRADRG
jgi:hypothetical protein